MEAGISFEAQPFLCPECKQSFVNSKKLNGHISGHKQKDEWFAETYGTWENENLERNNMLNG